MNIKLHNFRLEQQKTLQEMSDSIGVSKSTYEKVEYEQRTPSYNFVKKFKNKYPQCDTNSIFF